MIYLVELELMNPSTETLETFYFTSGGRMAPFLPSDAARPNRWYDPRVASLNGISQFIYSRGKTSGDSGLGAGTLTLTNADGAYDYLLDWGFTGRSISVYSGEGVSFSDYTLYFLGVIDTMEFEFSRRVGGNIKISLRSKKKLFEKDIQVNKFLGTNSGSTGDEGTTDSGIKGKLKPLCFGHVLNIEPVNVNSAGLRYQVHDGPIDSIPAVYDNGVALGYSATNPPAAGYYYVYTSTGIFVLGSKPAGQITCDVKGMTVSGTWKKTCSELVTAIVKTYGGLTDSDIDLTALSTLATDAPQTLGLYLNGVEAPKDGEITSSTITKALDSLCNSVGAYWLHGTDNKFTAGMFKVPDAGTSLVTFNQFDLIDIELVKNNDDNKGIPASKLTLKAVKNYTVQTSGLAGSVTEERKEWLKNDFRMFKEEDATNQAIYNSDIAKITKESLLTLTSEAETEATRLMTLYSSRRIFLRVIVDHSILPSTVKLGTVVTIQFPRFGMAAGKKFTVIGLAFNYPKLNQVEIDLYG